MIAVANGMGENPASTMIHCYRVSVKKQMDSLTLTRQSLPSFFLTGGAARDQLDISVTYLKWIYSEDSDSLLVGTKTMSGCFIELWGLIEKATPIHSHFKHLFQQPNKTEVFKTFVSMACPTNCIIRDRANRYIDTSFHSIPGLDASSELSIHKSHYRYLCIKISIWLVIVYLRIDGW